MTHVIEAQPDARAGYSVGIEGDERYLLTGLDREQAEYAVMLLKAKWIELDGTDAVAYLREAVTRVECSRCGDLHFSAEMDPAGRCTGCQP